jgi:hypothetical protein
MSLIDHKTRAADLHVVGGGLRAGVSDDHGMFHLSGIAGRAGAPRNPQSIRWIPSTNVKMLKRVDAIEPQQRAHGWPTCDRNPGRFPIETGSRRQVETHGGLRRQPPYSCFAPALRQPQSPQVPHDL